MSTVCRHCIAMGRTTESCPSVSVYSPAPLAMPPRLPPTSSGFTTQLWLASNSLCRQAGLKLTEPRLSAQGLKVDAQHHAPPFNSTFPSCLISGSTWCSFFPLLNTCRPHLEPRDRIGLFWGTCPTSHEPLAGSHSSRKGFLPSSAVIPFLTSSAYAFYISEC